MKCSACEARLGAYLEGDASIEDARAIEQHLAQCPACRAAVSDMRAVEVKLAGLREIEPRADFTQNVMASVALLPTPKPARLHPGWFLAYLAAAWAILVALSATHVLNWQKLFAQGAIEFGKIGAAGQTLAQVGGHFHVPTFVAAAVGFEMVVVVVAAIAVRHYLPRLSGWIAGAQAI